MVSPPNLAEFTQNTVDEYNKEINKRKDGLRERAGIITRYLKEMDNITTNPIEGAMYAFPKIHLNWSAVEAA
jgi:alanine transaminase